MTRSHSAGFFTSEHFGKLPRLQILTIEDLLSGAKRLEMPQSMQTADRTFKQAERMHEEKKDQGTLGFY